MGRNEHTPPGADNFRVGARGESHELAGEAVEKSAILNPYLEEKDAETISFDLVQRAFGLRDCSEKEIREARAELENRGYDLNAVNNDRGPKGLSVGQIMGLLELRKKE
ncbi:hypothetical protein COY62_02730 [bacterium (Candidatus Howlettbacteria) CG_4_10_14_0_8_um_filter_40_9]|nr:MAG: hypothetical protein COY62_02730 [bacterium (Candidatus Howlettbacteria) CG_4_10_14_0_8_um_filter_40_9]